MPDIYRFQNEVIAAELPVSETEFGQIKPETLQKMIELAKRELLAAGSGGIVLTKGVCTAAGSPENTDLFLKIAANAARAAAAKFLKKKPVCLAVRQKRPDKNGEKVISDLIYDSREIRLLTDNEEEAEIICENIMDEYGAAVRVFPYGAAFGGFLTVNLDSMGIEIGRDVFLSRFEVEADSFGYDVDTLSFAAAQGKNPGRLKITGCQWGKNKLTLDGF